MLVRSSLAAALLSPALSSAALSGSRFTWPKGRPGAVSLTYDDGLESQLDIALPALEALDLGGTFYLTRENIAGREADWRAAAERGHELGNHTISHQCDLRRVDPTGFMSTEVMAMEVFLNRLLPAQAGNHSFAYPCDVSNLGVGSPNRQARRFSNMLRQAGIVSARTSEGPPNSPHYAFKRRYRLGALAVGYDTSSLEEVANYLARAAAGGAWAILAFHDIDERGIGKGATKTADHSATLDMIRSLGLWCAPVRDVFGFITGALSRR